jgi:hypothetical protein
MTTLVPPKRGDNQKGFNVSSVAVRIDDEMEALESLGRATRQAILDAPIKFSAATVMMEISRQERELTIKYGREVQLDPTMPDLDRFLASEVMRKSILIVAQDRSREDAMSSIRPLRGKPSPKSVREQRRAMRRVRW